MKKQKRKKVIEPKIRSKATVRESGGFKIVRRDRGTVANPYGPPTGRT